MVALIYFNATFGFSQNEKLIDSLIQEIHAHIEIEYFSKAEEIFQHITTLPEYKNDSIRLQIDLELVKLYEANDLGHKTLETLLSGYSLAKDIQSSKFISDYGYRIGGKFSKSKNYAKAIMYFREILSYAEKQNDSLGISRAYLGLGSMNFHLYRLENDTLHYDSIPYYYLKAINILPKNEENKAELALLYANMIGFNYYERDFESAEEYGNLALNICKATNDTVQMSSVLNTLGAINIAKGNYERAEYYYNKSLGLVVSKTDLESLNTRQREYRNLADLYYRTEDFERAYDFRVKHQLLQDSISNINANRRFSLIEAKYNLAEEEKQTEVEKNKRERAEAILIVVGITVLVIFVLIFLFYRIQRVKKAKQLLELQQEQLTKEREIEKIQNESQIKILNATLDGKESERRQIAEILHNSVSALLSSAGLHLQAAKIGLKNDVPEEIVKSQEIVKEAGEKIRNLSHALISSVLLKFGLQYALDDLCEKYSNSKLKFNCDARGIKRYDSSFEIKMHSIIEELMNNIIKHSNATNTEITLKDEQGVLRVRIFDNGEGFDVEKLRTQQESGLGLPQIDARIKMMEGQFNIQSSAKAGTRIYMNVPIPSN